MTEPTTCPTCRAPLPEGAGAAGGLCPACLLRRGLETQTAGFTAAGPTAAPRWEPPGVAELGAQFPELEVLELLGRGGMGAVYKVRQRGLDRVAALKVLPPHLGSDPAFADRFAREARALAKLNHPNVVTLYEFGQTGAGLYFFLMEYVDGASLRRLMDAGRVAPREALAIVPQVCDALQYAHDHGVVHRDIKPENILLDRRGRVKVADFGLAKITGQEEPAAGGGAAVAAAVAVTEAGQVFGTPQYMAPEQAARPGAVDHRADIYALGVVFYQMLTGELPAGRIEPPSRKVVVDVRLDEVVLRALEREPGRRYGQASELKTDVETVAGVADAVPLDYRRPADPPADVPVPPAARLSRPAVAGICCCVAGVMATVVLVIAYREMRNPGATLTTLGRVLLFVSVPVAVAAPFATTILGWTAVAQIRRSAGRRYGLGLALFDGLLFPLLVLNALLVWLAGGFRLGAPEAFILALPLDAWLVWKAWRAAKRPDGTAAPTQGEATPPRGIVALDYARGSRGWRLLRAARRTAPIWGGAAIGLAVIILALLAWVQQPRAVGAVVSADSPDRRYSASATTIRAVRVFGADRVYYRVAVRGPGGKPAASWEVPFPQSGLLARQNQSMLLSQLTFAGNGAIRWSDDGGRVDFELTAPDGTIVNLGGYDVRAGSPTAGRGFGPERRLVLAGSRDLKGCFADLDTGEVLSAPTTWVQALRSRGHLYEGATPPSFLGEWMEPAGADLFKSATLNGSDVPWPVLQLGGVVTYMAESSFSFDTISADQVAEWTERTRAARPAATHPAGGPDFFPLQPDTLHAFKTREGSLGVLQYHDDGPGRIEVRYKLVADAPTTRPNGRKPSSPPATRFVPGDGKPAAFGPVVERTLPDPDNGDGRTDPQTLRLRSGQMLNALAGARGDGGAGQRLRALLAGDGDLFAEYDDYVSKRWALVTAGLKLGDLPARQWDAATAADLDEALKAPTAIQHAEHGGAVLYLPPDTVLPTTLAFEARDGTRGLLQITGFRDNPRAVTIRYKLAQPNVGLGR